LRDKIKIPGITTVEREATYDVLGLLVIWICINLESIERFDADVDVFGKTLDDTKALGKRSAALELETLSQAV
jgi:hypothetical protein